MKKLLNTTRRRKHVFKFDLKMKLSILFLLVTFFSLKASDSYSQRTKITLKLNHVSVGQLIDEIEGTTEFQFVYKIEDVDLDRTISIRANNYKIDKILNQIFGNTTTTFNLNDRRIYLVRRKETTITRPLKVDTDVPIVQNEIRGTISDKDGAPLSGANIVEKGTINGVTADFDGNFSISVTDDKAILVVSYIGFANKEIPINGQSNISVVLQESAAGLDEVVVVGYGTVKKRDLTSSVAKVSGEALENRVVSRLDEALQGKLAGVTVQQTSGVPGAAPVVRVRGTASITEGNQPLWVIDGMPIEDASIIANVNMSDAESIEVLKDAAAAAIYGSRGSNGVIIVTTKSGKSGKPSISYNTSFGFQKAEKTIDFLTGPEQGEILAEYRAWQWANSGGDPNTPNDDRPNLQRIDPNWLTGNVGDYDVQDLIYRTAPTQNHNLSLTGGTEKTKYFMSLDYLNQEGITIGTSFERFSIRTNLETKVNDLIDVGLKVAASSSTQMNASTEGKDGQVNNALLNASFMDGGDYYFLDDGFTFRNDYDYYYGLRNAGNRLYALDNLEQKYIRPQALVNAHINLNLADGLNFKTAAYYRYNAEKFSERKDIILGGGNPSANISNFYSSNWTIESTLNYAKQFNKHSITGLLGYSSQKENSESSSISGRGFPNDLSLTLNNATEIPSWGESINEWSLVSMFARATYGFDSRYLLSASIRRDGSSRFGANNKWGMFPAVSGAWNISEEAFMDNVDHISNLKLRASYGKTGNNRIGNYRHYATLSTANVTLGSDESIVSGLVPGSFANNDLTWERTATTNLGLDISFLKNRINLSVDVYEALTEDLLLSVPLPIVSGFSSTIQNIGEVSNKGIEIELISNNINSDNFQWNTQFNYSYNKNEVLKMGPNDAPILDGEWYSRVSQTAVGEAIGSFYLWETDGVFQNQAEVDEGPIFRDEGVGDVRFVDQDGDGDVDADDRTVLGQPMPKYNFGITNTFKYKDFDLSVFLNGAGGHKIYNIQSRGFSTAPISRFNMFGFWADRWRSESDPGDGSTPKITSTTGTNGATPQQDRWLYDASWWRVKNVTLGYNFPKSVLEKINMSRLRFYVSADNLFLNTDYIGSNPEGVFGPGSASRGTSQSEGSASRSWGYDYGSIPLPKTFMLGLNITF
ncbi:TonB-dependent receptor [Arenibacter sp. F26102]|uniref:TonB-dependent receptor n=1 Tax=Arenibacter sp. F26102 TaxID=2926416 RepID=UPI001FF263A5|nr:TonB-dependent receptor [Arenibacter sp. F26102]MCK0147279.1 TonB-dependent receptor [Arenibacter sp. F26102]